MLIFIHCHTQCKARTVPEKYKIGGLASATGQAWKDTRNILTPAFSTSKLKNVIWIVIVIATMCNLLLHTCTDGSFN